MREQELIDRLRAHVAANYAGSFRKCFLAYDVDADNKISATELGYLLSDARVGNVLTRSMWVKGVIDRLDADKDGCISWEEFEQAIQGRA